MKECSIKNFLICLRRTVAGVCLKLRLAGSNCDEGPQQTHHEEDISPHKASHYPVIAPMMDGLSMNAACSLSLSNTLVNAASIAYRVSNR
ncbi:hypothetical protein Zmor_019229 [Zophobas morio]|uniref:Uncharacterized protein n=1 Tax=Zophobas morio TaxID=2755281 RepID=A0AA38M8D6_9CUCU|nr:hypothetical protein Zmor_019229 [Zophobas morio]